MSLEEVTRAYYGEREPMCYAKGNNRKKFFASCSILPCKRRDKDKAKAKAS
jgi:hypothetical protein